MRDLEDVDIDQIQSPFKLLHRHAIWRYCQPVRLYLDVVLVG